MAHAETPVSATATCALRCPLRCPTRLNELDHEFLLIQKHVPCARREQVGELIVFVMIAVMVYLALIGVARAVSARAL